MKTSQQYECIIDELFEKSEYNPLVRPVTEINETVTVQFSVQLSQIVDIVSTYHYKNLPKQYAEILSAVKMKF